MANENFHSGFAAIVGRPNVGKSSLLNRWVGQKLSITSQRPQTTRHRILGIRHRDTAQIVFVDTPGIHGANDSAMNQHMNRVAKGSVNDVDVIVLVISARGWTAEDEAVLKLVQTAAAPCILVINKIDMLANKEALLPLIADSHARHAFAEIVPMSAKAGENTDAIFATVIPRLPLQPAIFPPDQLTDRNERFLAAELIREQVFRVIGQEIPYACTVEIEGFKEEARLTRIDATIWVEKEGQKAILIGAGGLQLKRIGERARRELQDLLARKVFLGLWVKVRAGWSDDARALRSLGYGDDN